MSPKLSARASEESGTERRLWPKARRGECAHKVFCVWRNKNLFVLVFPCFAGSFALLLLFRTLLFANFRICCVPFVSSFVHNRFFCVAVAVFSRLPLCFWLHAQLCGDFDLRLIVRLYAALAGFGGPLLSYRIPATFWFAFIMFCLVRCFCWFSCFNVVSLSLTDLCACLPCCRNMASPLLGHPLFCWFCNPE